MFLPSALRLLFRILVLCSPLFWSYTSRTAYRSSTSRYIRLFTDTKDSKGYEIESIFSKSDVAYRENRENRDNRDNKDNRENREKMPPPLRTEPQARVNSNKPRYNPTNENKKSKYSATKMKLRSTGRDTPSHSTSSSREHVQEMLKMAQKGPIETLLRAITTANNATIQSTISATKNSTALGRLNIREYNMLIKELCDGGRIQECSKILVEMGKAGVKPSVVTYTTLISRAGAWQKVQLAEMYFRKMLDDGIRADAQAYNSLINAYAKAGETDRALRVLNDMDIANVLPTVVTFNTLIESCARNGKAQRAREVLELMKKRGLNPDERSFSAVVQSCCQAGQVESAYQLVRRMDEDGIKVSSYTYSSLLHGLGKMGDLNRAFEVLDRMKLGGIRPNVVTMSSLVYSCGKHGKLDLAIQIYREMLRSSLEEDRPNSITCSSLVDACLKAGKVAKAFAVVQDMRARKVPLTEVTYTSLITELTRLKQLDRILEAIVGDAEESGEGVEGVGVNGVDGVKGHSSVTPVFPTSAETISALDSKFDRPSTQGPILTESAAELMEMFREKSNHEGVVSVYEAMKTRGVTPGARVYKTLMNSLYEDSVRRSDGTESTSETSREGTPVKQKKASAGASASSSNSPTQSQSGSSTGSTADKTGSAAGLNDYSSQNKQMRHDELFRLYLVFQEMRTSGVQADAAVYNTLINACAGVGDLEKALETVQAMQDEGIHLDVITYTSLLKACGINGSPGTVALAEEIFAQMQQKTNHFSNKVEPTELTFQRLMQAHVRAPEGQVDTARVWELLDDMVKRDLKPGVVSYRACVKAAALEGDVDRSLAMLLVIRDQTRIGFDFRSWQAVAYLCSMTDRKDEEFMLRREIEERNNLMISKGQAGAYTDYK